MFKYVAKRVMISLVTLFVIIFILYLMLEFMPGSPFNDEKLTATQRALLNAKYGLDQPFLIKFFNYLKCVFQGDFGVSYAINKNFAVTDMVLPRLAVTVRIGGQAVILGTIIGLVLGLIAALYHNTWIDTLTSMISVLGISVPSFVFAIGMLYLFGAKLKWFPILYQTSQPFMSSVIPTIAMSMFTIANIARFTRSEMIEVLNSDYILLAQAKGVSQFQLIVKHALRNALIPIVTVLGPLIVGLLTGSLVIEKIFSIPGLGFLMVNAIQMNDYNVVIAVAFIYSALYIFTMLGVDILYGIIDPRIRLVKGAKQYGK